MLSTGMRAPIGIKVYGPDLLTIEGFGLELEKVLRLVPSIKASSVFADRIVGKPYMEFNIDRIEKPLGVITASKLSDADSSGEKTGLFFLDMLCVVSGGGSCDASSTARDDQHITLTMVVLPSLARANEYSVRITIQRVIHDQMDRIKVLERIDDAETYQTIFDNLRKSLFLQEGDA